MTTFIKARQTLIQHELGHWLVARHEGFKVGGISITFKADRLGRLMEYFGSSHVLPAPEVACVDDVQRYLRSRITVLFAGICAEVLGRDEAEINSGLMTHLLNTSGKADYRVIEEHMPLLRALAFGGCPDDDTAQTQCDQLVGEIWQSTCEVVEGLKGKILWMADRLKDEVVDWNREYVFEYERLARLESMSTTPSAPEHLNKISEVIRAEEFISE